MSAAHDDFVGPSLVIGEIYGMRSWVLENTEGELASIAYSHDWQPGVNSKRRCGNCDRWDDIVKPPEGSTWVSQPGDMSMSDCSCGFYAYYTPKTGYAVNARCVSGIVKGYGRTVVGDKGFRASKMEIVAFVRPKHLQPAKSKRHVRWSWVVLVVGLVTLGFGVFGNGTSASVSFLLGVANTLAFMMLIASTRDIDVMPGGEAVTHAMWDALMLKYSEAQVFDSMKEARRAYDLKEPKFSDDEAA